MIPGAEEILAGYPFVKRRWRIQQDASDSAVRAAVEDARTLAGSEAQTEPAALFFAFAEQWQQREYCVKRWGAFSFPTPLLNRPGNPGELRG